MTWGDVSQVRACESCGCEFAVHPRERHRRRFCSEACRVREHRRRAGSFVRSPTPDAVCAWCSERFVRRRPQNVCCSSVCSRRWGLAEKVRKFREGQARHPCPACGCEVVGGRSNSYCAGCAPGSRAEGWRRKNRRRRMARRMSTAGAYTLTEIAERDGFRCHLCGGSVSMSLSGMEKWGPTIDHLLPISLGGLDDRANVALAHRVCNVRRGNRGIVQLRLVG